MANRIIKQFLEDPPEQTELFLRGALRRVESVHREMALLVLTEWEDLSIFVPELYQVFASLVRVSWGHWNGRVRRQAVRRLSPPGGLKLSGSADDKTAAFLSSP